LSGRAAGRQLSSVRALRKRDAIIRRSLGLSDALAFCMAVVLTVLLVGGGAGRIRPALVLVAPFVVLVSKALGLYDRDQHRLRKATIDEAPTLLHLAVICALTVWLTEGVLLYGALNRAQVLLLTVLGFALAFGSRAATRAIVLSLTSPERCLLVGDVDDATRAAARLESAGTNAVMVGRIALDDEVGGSAGSSRVPGGFPTLAETIARHAAERVIIAPGDHDQEEVLHCIRLVTALGVKVSVLPRLLEVVGSSSVFDDVDGITLLGVRQFGLSKSSEFLKRAMDIAGAACGLALLAPLLALTALAIRLDSPGSPLFVQWRIGRQGKRFRMIKFRTMVRGADHLKEQMRDLNEAEGGLFKINDDPRITRVGRVLRRTSLDELLQLINVLKGDMSLVGPRPLVLDEDALLEGWQRRRLAVKPGMTGLWQILGSPRIPMPEMVKLDYLYGANWSIWLDLKILLRTVPYVLRRRGP
jgi:exopolysaccharide biosynthesis polyprenyl glycosylphosphotransferase